MHSLQSTVLALFLCSAFVQADEAPPPSETIQLVDPETSPPEIRNDVMRGYRIMLYTKQEVPDYAGDVLSCTNCHFSGGNTFGGLNGGISLVGVFQKYPIEQGEGKLYTLAERVNACFEKSLNGRALPVNGGEMKAILSYLEWISQPVKKLKNSENIPWLGGMRQKIRIDHTVDPKNGEKLYATRCALCHGADGQGQPQKEDLGYPPLWGPRSFNDAAGMNVLPVLTIFIHQNMPYEDPSLTLGEAIDIAAFIISQPRPHYEGAL